MSDSTLRHPQNISIRRLGLLDYGLCLDLMHDLHARVVSGEEHGIILLVEHPPVITLGQNSNARHILAAPSDLDKLGVQVHVTDRGGEATAHEPGQLVVYPILRLSEFSLLPRRYVDALTTSVINVLASYDIVGTPSREFPGVWTDAGKIAAVGVRIRQRVSLHGLALNVANDLKTFALITPCGLVGRAVTSMEQMTGKKLNLDEVASRLSEELLCQFSAAASRSPASENDI